MINGQKKHLMLLKAVLMEPLCARNSPWQLLLCVAGSVEVSRRSPVASWLCAMLYCFGSYILADIMLGSSPIDYFQHNSHILLASAVWWENPQKPCEPSRGGEEILF